MSGSIRTRLPRPRGLRRFRMRKPSTWWPSIATRQDEAFLNIWQALRQHESVRSGAPQPETWSDRAESFVICAIRVPASDELNHALAPMRKALEQFPFVRLYPAGALYITIQEMGFLVETPSRPDETAPERIQEFIRHAALPISDFPAFDIDIGGFNSFLDTPFLDVHDDGWCFRVHHRLRDFALLHLTDDFAFLPHIVLGYYTESASMGSFPARLAPWRDSRMGSFTAQTLDVLEISTTEPFSQPTVLHSFELGHQRGAADAITSSNPNDVF